MDRPLLGFVGVLLVLSVAVVPLATTAQAGSQSSTASLTAHPDRPLPASDVQTTETSPAGNNSTRSVETDSILLSVDVNENGSAQWRIEYRTRLDDGATTEAFRRLQRDVQAGSAGTNEAFFDTIRSNIDTAQETTGREMSGTEFDVRTNVREIPRRYGVVVYSFRWQGFASVSDRQLRVGDALGGFFLGPGERLVISWPEGYERSEVDPEPDVQRERAVVWRGQTAFGPDGPRLVLTERPWPGTRALALGAIATVALVAVLWSVRRPGNVTLPSFAARLFDDSDEDAELLSNEERVVRLLEERGGRIRQQKVADELGWTETKTSYVVSNLREEGRVHSFRLGRENVLSLSDSLDLDRSGT